MVIILFFALQFLLLGFVFLMLQMAWRPIFLNEPPFYPTPARAIDTIIKELELTPESILYDLGCGDGRILFKCLERSPGARGVGIEHDLIPFLMAQLERRRYPGKNNVRFVMGDVFSESCRDATHVFLFTYPKFIDELLPYLEKELKPGTRAVLLDFPFSHKLPEKMVEIPGSGVLGKCVYVYEF